MSETQTLPDAKAGWFTRLANPTRFIGLADKLIPWLLGLAGLLLAVGLWMSFTAPEDYQQGITVQIMYVHVPFAWLAMMCYTVMAISSVGTLVWRHPLADVSAKAAAPIGAAFTLISLITRSPLTTLGSLIALIWLSYLTIQLLTSLQTDTKRI